MRRGLPQSMQDVNVYIDGRGHLGNIKSFKLPEIKQGMIEAKGGISGNYGNGSFDAMDISFKLNITDAKLYWDFGLNTFINKVPLVFKGSIYQDAKSLPIVAMIMGDFETITPGEFEANKEIETDVKMNVHTYELLVNNKQSILIDTRNSICLIGGVDYFAKMRENL